MAKKPLTQSLKLILKKTEKKGSIKLGIIFEILSRRGYSVLLIIFSLPFCLPIPLPILSTPFGIIIAFLGLRIAFAEHVLWPKWVLEKKLENRKVHAIATKAMSVEKYIEKLVHPRWVELTKNHFRRLLGLTVCFLGILLAIPFPFPFTNLFSALPLLCFGIGLLWDDGFFILIGYFMTLVDFTFLFLLFFFGKRAFESLLNLA